MALAGLEYLFVSQMKAEKEAVRNDAMMPVAVSGDYALVRSAGSIGSMLSQVEVGTGYSIAVKALDKRMSVIEDEGRSTAAFWNLQEG